MCVDILEYVPRVMRAAIVSAYNGMIRKSPWLWERLYRDTDARPRGRPAPAFWNALHRRASGVDIKRLLRDLEKFKPHAILATHFFGMAPFLDRWDHSAPVYFVCTDYLSHSLQRDPRFDGWFVGSGEAVRQYMADNVPTAGYAVKNFGIPIARDYLAPPTREEARRLLETGGDVKLAAVLDSGSGARLLDAVVGSMVELTEWKVVVLCRDNKKLYERLRDKYFPFKHITFEDGAPDIASYYAASDAVILDPNGVQMAEASAAGAAMLLMEPIAGLGRSNCDYVLERGAARKIYEHRKTGELIRNMIESRDALERMKYRARAMSRPNAGKDIITYVMERADAEERGGKQEKT
jgi:processive 1,2-diacylglycerol beta-glucosyltransferase